jgi:DNA mismatch repair protein MutS
MSKNEPQRLSQSAEPGFARTEAEGRATPMMVQYIEIKTANPDCLLFYRMGDFYELFFEDAETASRALGIVLTKRGKHLGQDIRMCGVPIERANEYLHRLIALGHRVAVCEQTEDPAEAKRRGPKSVVSRAVVRVVTPGTLTEDSLLDPRKANVLVAASRLRVSDEESVYGLAALDISTGAFLLSETGAAGLSAEIARLEPAEVVAPESLCDDPRLRTACEDWGAPLTQAPRRGESSPERLLCDWYGVAALDGFGAFTRAEIAAAATALSYVQRTQIGSKPALAPPSRREAASVMQIDAATRANLELTRAQSGAREGSLLDAIDMTVTPAGGRLLAERLASPLTDPEAIAQRLDCVAFFIENADLRPQTRASLRAAPDLTRAVSRLALARGGPRDLATVRDGVQAARQTGEAFADIEAPREISGQIAALAALEPRLEDSLRAALVDEPPHDRRDGGFVRPGFSEDIDAARRLRDETRKVVAGLQARYCEIAGAKQLKVKHNNFLGYFIEVPPAVGERLLRPPLAETFRHRQTMAEAMRFSTNELAQLEAEIASAADRALSLEFAAFDALAGEIAAQRDVIKRAADALAGLDVASALAETAILQDWTRPLIDRSLAFMIEGGRHPVVEAALAARGKTFVANDCDLSGDDAVGGRIAVMTGPNMAGKSTYLRQNALIAALAQTGSFVPAKQARLGVVDRLFSRVGAADDLARGRSTFMVEMVETASILNQATSHSFVILDEIGRGTATFDGLSIAWASAEHLHDTIRARALFATHFHELTQLSGKLPRLVNLTMRVTEWRGDVVFLHEVLRGAADRSYGIQVAKLAGLPAKVIDRARSLLAQLEAKARSAPASKLFDDLPLFSHAAAPPQAEDPLRKAVEELDPDALTPRQALEALYRLRSMLNETHRPEFEGSV